MIRYNAQCTIRNLLFVYIKCNLQHCSLNIYLFRTQFKQFIKKFDVFTFFFKLINKKLKKLNT